MCPGMDLGQVEVPVDGHIGNAMQAIEDDAVLFLRKMDAQLRYSCLNVS